MKLTTRQADTIRQAWYVMDGTEDRPTTIGEAIPMIVALLGILGTITGITSASAVSPAEANQDDIAEDNTHVCQACGVTWHRCQAGQGEHGDRCCASCSHLDPRHHSLVLVPREPGE